MIYYSIYKSSFGDIFLASTDRGVCKMTLQHEGIDEFFNYIAKLDNYRESTGRNSKYLNQLDEYFNGRLKNFDIDLDIKGTDFQKRVWNELMQIPYGQVRSYKDISRNLGMSCPRAVGQANKKNPVPIIIPCHRVVSASGIGGYSGETSGRSISLKKYLLEIEGFDCSVFNKVQ